MRSRTPKLFSSPVNSPSGSIKSKANKGLRRGRSLALLALMMPAYVPSTPAAQREITLYGPMQLSPRNNDLVEDISRRSFRYFWEQMDPGTGLVLDRARFDGTPEDQPHHYGVASIAATGFGLTALAIGAEHRWVSPRLARARARTALEFFAYRAPQEHGWFYHFMDTRTGQRSWRCEVSTIDTALLLAGILTARTAFGDDPEIVRLATAIYNRVDFPWMLDPSGLVLRHGWRPETGFLPYRWDTYSEQMILYLLGIGSPTHPISPDAWYSWNLPVVQLAGHAYVGTGPLFTQQYSQAWVDLRGRGVPHPLEKNRFVPRVDYFANSVSATRAQQEFSLMLKPHFPGYSKKIWGITASESARGYVNWGGSLADTRIDGTVVPSAAGGSLVFAPDICIPAMRAMVDRFGKTIYGRYGFTDAFNPNTGWISPYVLGIDAGIILLSAENLRTMNVWQWFMSNADVERGLDFVGYAPDLSLAFSNRAPTVTPEKKPPPTGKNPLPAPSPPPSPSPPKSKYPPATFNTAYLLCGGEKGSRQSRVESRKLKAKGRSVRVSAPAADQTASEARRRISRTWAGT